jgi:hypothetical protein
MPISLKLNNRTVKLDVSLYWTATSLRLGWQLFSSVVIIHFVR